jgi:hypothetical protein
MEFKGTKGKWEYTYQPIVSNGLYIQTIDKNHKNTFIGEVGGGLQSPNEIQANATLIAAAPDLLEALQDMIFIFESLCESEKLKLKPTDFNCYNDSKAAIKKALTIK